MVVYRDQLVAKTEQCETLTDALERILLLAADIFTRPRKLRIGTARIATDALAVTEAPDTHIHKWVPIKDIPAHLSGGPTEHCACGALNLDTHTKKEQP